MTRRYPPSTITVDHSATELAEWQRRAAAPDFVPARTPEPEPEPPARPKPTRPATTPDRPVLSARRPTAPKRSAKPAPSKPTPTRRATADELDEATINRVIDHIFGGEE